MTTPILPSGEVSQPTVPLKKQGRPWVDEMLGGDQVNHHSETVDGLEILHLGFNKETVVKWWDTLTFPKLKNYWIVILQLKDISL